jgi:hypothetical protein
MTTLDDVGPLTIAFNNDLSRHWALKRCVDPFKQMGVTNTNVIQNLSSKEGPTFS